MKYKMFCIFDSKVEAYNTPFAQRTSAEAIRAFSEAVKADKMMSAHGEDYHLMELGAYDDQTGLLVPLPAPHALAIAIQFVNLRDVTMHDIRQEGLVPSRFPSNRE